MRHPSTSPRSPESPRSSIGGSSGAALTPAQWFAREERKAIDAFLQDRELEVVVILEGTDTSTGSTVQVGCRRCVYSSGGRVRPFSYMLFNF